jgi:hypothetical protein
MPGPSAAAEQVTPGSTACRLPFTNFAIHQWWGRALMNEGDRAQMWKFTAIGILAVVATAVITGLVVANRTAPNTSGPPSSVAQAPTAPAAAPSAPAAAAAPATRAPRSGVPSQEVVNACNHRAAAQAGSAPREGKDKVIDVGKDAGIGALGGAAVGAAGGAIAGGGKGAGKGALIGGLVGAGGGTLYGMWDNKKNDERFREAYGTCMHAHGYTG